jgi:protein-S-isoprenylcysteine O-methyltransferase Ste14
MPLQFSVMHSFLLHPKVRDAATRWIPSAFYGSFYCVATCLGLWLTFAGWQKGGGALWQWHGTARLFVVAAFFASWVALFYSLALTGLGYQTGLTPWWHWLRRRPLPKREFRPRGAYQWLRHPVYLSFLGLIWFTPVMTYDRAVLVSVWTIYIFVGSHLKDRRLLFYLGDTYRAYQARVPGYPFLLFGPLGRIPLPEAHQAQLSGSVLDRSHTIDRPHRSHRPLRADQPCRSKHGDTVSS